MVSNIIHLSDIHIRAGNQDKSRYQEYVATFDNLFTSIAALPYLQESIIVITGDLFHHKNRLEPCALKLALYLLAGLSPLAPVYLIRGNHDYRQDVPNELDMISALMSHDIKNVTYLDKTGTYYHENIGFGLVAIQDTLLYGSTSGICSDLPLFPVPDMVNCEYKIALFHGTISGTTLSSQTVMHGYPIDWFQGFDAILLGDIHLQQVHRAVNRDPTVNRDPVVNRDSTVNLGKDTVRHLAQYVYDDTVPWAYPGSLIQQDFGESVIGHGYLVWNLPNKTIDAFHVYNPYGFLKIRDDVIVSPYSFKELLPMMPMHLRICTTGDCQDTVKRIIDAGKNVLFIKTSEQKQLYEDTVASEQKQKDLIQINSIDVLIDYIQNVITGDNRQISNQWKSWLKNPELLLISTAGFPEPLVKKVADRSDKIQKAADKFKDEFEKCAAHHSTTGTFHIHLLQWNWILNYKDGNCYDFDKSQHQISIINSKNGTGKSNFLEIICIALFGEGFPSRENSNYSAGIICDKKPEGFSPNTTIVFSINDVKYKLHRIMRTNTITRLISYDKIILSIVESNAESNAESNKENGVNERILHQQTKAVSEWIDVNIGSIDTYLMTAMLSQNSDRDFFTLDKATQKKLLDKIMSINHIDSLKAFLKETDKYYRHVCELIETYHDGAIGNGQDPRLIQQLQEAQMAAELSAAQCCLLKSKWNHIPERGLNTLAIDSVQSEYDGLIKDAEQNEASTRLECIHRNIAQFTAMLDECTNSIVSALKIHSGETTVTLAKLNKNKIHVAHLKHALEEHPYYKTHSLCDSVEVVDETYANQECSQELFQANRNFETWNAIKMVEFAEIEDTDSSQLLRELEQYNGVLKERPLLLAAHQKQMKIMRKKYLVKRKEKEEHQDKRPNRPSRDLEWLDNVADTVLNSVEETVALETQLVEAIHSIPLLCNGIQSLESKITAMETYLQGCVDTPFNAKCKACRLQPWKKTHDEYVAELPSLKTQLDASLTRITALTASITVHLNEFNIHSYDAYIHVLEEHLEEIRSSIALYHEYQKEHKLYTEYEEWAMYNDMLCKECDETEKLCDELELSCKQDETAIADATAQKYTVEATLAKLNYKRKEYDAYCAELIERKRIFEENAGKIAYNWYSVLREYQQYVSNLIVFLQNHIAELNAERTNLQRMIEQSQRAAELQCLIEAYPHWQQWKAEVEAHQRHMLLVRELETKQGKIGKTGIDLDGLKETMGVVSYLSDKFDGYREWLYKGHIGPMIEKHVNQVLQIICEDRPLYLEAEWLDKISTLSWFVRDGSSRPVIEKASGFQRFIVGMATRVAFHQIGFCRINCNQLFIDEGFTSCDSENLERVPDFLRGLLQLYNSIYLATHLDELKGCSTTQICIQRDAAGLSQIRYGAVENAVVEPLKKKGRPAKNKIQVLRSE